MWKMLWQKWTIDKPAILGDWLWDVLVVQLAAFLDRLTVRRAIAFIPGIILVLAYCHSIPIPPERMLLGDLLTVLSENLPIKIVIFDNGKLGFIDIEQKAVGLIPIYTGLKNPDFGKIAEVMGFWGRLISKAGELESAITEWLAQPGPALLQVKVKEVDEADDIFVKLMGDVVEPRREFIQDNALSVANLDV